MKNATESERSKHALVEQLGLTKRAAGGFELVYPKEHKVHQSHSDIN
jgi:hypothetical protein